MHAPESASPHLTPVPHASRNSYPSRVVGHRRSSPAAAASSCCRDLEVGRAPKLPVDFDWRMAAGPAGAMWVGGGVGCGLARAAAAAGVVAVIGSGCGELLPRWSRWS
jgi:hypothetical protein